MGDLSVFKNIPIAAHRKRKGAHVALEMTDKQSSITFETYQMVLQAAVVGLGVAIVPIVIVQQELVAGDLVALFGPPLSTGQGVYLAYPSTKENHAPFAAFRDWLLSCREDALVLSPNTQTAS